MKLSTFPATTPAGPPPASSIATGVRSSVRLSPDGYSIWLHVTDLDDGATITWTGADDGGPAHGDEALYVLDGALAVDGQPCPTDGAVVVEAGAAARATAVGPARVAHFGAADPEPPADGRFGPPSSGGPGGHGAHDGRGVHVVAPSGWARSGTDEVGALWYADSTCPTCRATLLKVSAEKKRDGRAHTHSEDEIILLLRGSIRLGAVVLEAGGSLCVPAGVRYAVRSGDDGYAFLNFRRDVSEQVYERGSEPLLETALAMGGELLG